jgi:hypothetical protein
MSTASGRARASTVPGLGWSDTLSAHRRCSPQVRQRARLHRHRLRPVARAGADRQLQLRRQRPRAARGGATSCSHRPGAKIRPGAQFFVNRLIRRDNVKDDALITDECPTARSSRRRARPSRAPSGFRRTTPAGQGSRARGGCGEGASPSRSRCELRGARGMGVQAALADARGLDAVPGALDRDAGPRWAADRGRRFTASSRSAPRPWRRRSSVTRWTPRSSSSFARRR